MIEVCWIVGRALTVCAVYFSKCECVYVCIASLFQFQSIESTFKS